MEKNQPPVLSKRKFLSKVAPFFDETKAKILSVLHDDREWCSFLSRIHLVYIDNTKVGRKSHIYLSDQIEDNLFLADSEPAGFVCCSSSDNVRDGYVYLAIIDHLRYVFVRELLIRASPKQIAGHFLRLLQSNYRQVDCLEEPGYIRLTVSNLSFPSELPLFAISAYRVNVIVPLLERLRADEIRDHTADNKKALITNKTSLEGYENFDQTLGIAHLTFHFCNMDFTSAVALYREVLQKSYQDVFKIVDLLRTTGESEVYELKKRLVHVDVSDGKAFQDCLLKFLSVCFAPCFEDVPIKKQVPNRGRLRVRDFVIANKHSTSHFLASLKAKGVDLLLFDAKNYAEKLSTRDIDTFKEYLRENPYFGNFGVIITRMGASRNCKESIFRALLSSAMKILVLDETDLLLMLDYVDSGKNAVDVLERKLEDLLLQM
jgi:hypothetical protein